MSELEVVLERSREMISEALQNARAELALLQAREATLRSQIAEAERALGMTAAPNAAAALTLHEALAQVLRETGNEGMTARELTEAVNARGLYRKRDGSPVEVNQVQARINNYDSVFEKVGASIRLRQESDMLAVARQSFTIFQDDDDGLFDWVDAHPDGHIINTERNPKPSFLVLHRAECRHLKEARGVDRTKNFVKVCSEDRTELEEWALDTVGGEVTLCRTCFG